MCSSDLSACAATVIAVFAATAVVPPAFADPPPWAPAHGYRAKKGKKFKNRTGVAFSYYCIGKIYQAKGELDKATSYAEKSLQIRHELGEKTGIAWSKIQIAELLLLRGRLKSAIQSCDEGEEDCEILENNYGRIVAREIRGRILMQLGEFEKAT